MKDKAEQFLEESYMNMTLSINTIYSHPVLGNTSTFKRKSEFINLRYQIEFQAK